MCYNNLVLQNKSYSLLSMTLWFWIYHVHVRFVLEATNENCITTISKYSTYIMMKEPIMTCHNVAYNITF